MVLLLAALTLSAVSLGAQSEIPDGLRAEMDVPYTAEARMDIVRPKQADAALPAVVLIHGGGFVRGDRKSLLNLATTFANRGYVAATIGYRLAPQHPYPAALHDAKAAVRFLRANAGKFGIDPPRIVTLGYSAGAYLALFLGLTPGIEALEGSGPHQDQSSAVSCVVNYFGPTDFMSVRYKAGDGSVAGEVVPKFLGGDQSTRPEAHVRASPIHWITPLAVPILSLHGTADTVVPYGNSVELTKRLKEIGIRTDLVTIEGGGHGFRGSDAELAGRRAFEFLDGCVGKQDSAAAQ